MIKARVIFKHVNGITYLYKSVTISGLKKFILHLVVVGSITMQWKRDALLGILNWYLTFGDNTSEEYRRERKFRRI